MSRTHLSRRTILKGLGTTMALPLLDAMLPGQRLLSSASAGGIGRRAGADWRLSSFPTGPSWTPGNAKARAQTTSSRKRLEPLADFKNDINVFSGLTQHHGRANGDGGGDHARNAGVFLTGCQPRKTSGANIEVGRSVDQAIASVIGSQTRLPSLGTGRRSQPKRRQLRFRL